MVASLAVVAASRVVQVAVQVWIGRVHARVVVVRTYLAHEIVLVTVSHLDGRGLFQNLRPWGPNGMTRGGVSQSQLVLLTAPENEPGTFKIITA